MFFRDSPILQSEKIHKLKCLIINTQLIYNKIVEEITTVLNDNEAPVEAIPEQLQNILNNLPERERSNDKESQISVLNSLGNNLIQEMRGHVYSVIRNEEQRKNQGESNQLDIFEENPENFIRGHLKGEIFERLVVLDPEIRKDRFDEVNFSEIKDIESLSNEILSVMQNPERYGLEESINLKRLPDATYIKITREGFIEITGVGEAKSGNIDDRFYSQVSNYQKSIDIISKGLSKIRHPKRLRNLGLNHLADRMEKSDMVGSGNFIRASSNIQKTLIIPQNKIIEEEWVEDCVDNIVRSCFTTYEIDAITNWTLDEIKKSEM